MIDAIQFHPDSPIYESDQEKENEIPNSDSKLESIKVNK